MTWAKIQGWLIHLHPNNEVPLSNPAADFGDGAVRKSQIEGALGASLPPLSPALFVRAM